MIISTNPSAAARAAAQQLLDRVHAYMASHPESELHRCGKMFGVLLYNSPLDGFSQLSTLHSPLYLSAFSAKLDGSYHHDGFVPPVYEMTAPPVGTSREESQRLQRLLFANYTFLNSHGQTKNLLELFENEKIISADEWFNQPLNSQLSSSLNSKLSTLNSQLPPSGAGECCAPKLLQYAYAHGLTPIELAEFWIGAPSHTEIRQEGTFYLPCSGKCTPILKHMVDGYEIQDQRATWKSSEIEVLYEDEVIMVINKPAGLLSVPGKNDEPSVQSLLKAKPVHRLDQDTSGLLVLAKTPEAYTALQSYFQRRDVLKRYVAIVKPNPLSTLNSKLSTLNSKLDGFSQLSTLNSQLLEGQIDLPLLPNPYDRPRQMVDLEHGKTAITRYVIREQRPDGTLLVDFYPLTGRTHQLRVHAAHPDGLNAPIVGDRLYSNQQSPITNHQSPLPNRLLLHAAEISFPHPLTGEMMHFTSAPGTIIFDLDGTLLNTIDDLGYACNYALEQTGYPTHPIADYPRMVGNGINNLIRRALPEGQRTEENILRVRAHFVPYYDAHNCDYTRPYDGIPELLAALKAQGHQLAVASNKYQAATEKIVNHFFPGIFDVILGEREGIERKPNPQIVYDILSTFNYKLDDFSQLSTLYLGDSLVDRDTAANAHVPFVACSWGFVSREALMENGVTRIIDTPEELLLDVYIQQYILPQYDAFDGGHRRDHARTVISESIKLARAYEADETMSYVIAAYHDLGLKFDREHHHIHSGEILMADENLRHWFSHDQLRIMREAVEDHRASSKNPPRTIYGAIVAEADRQIDPLTVIHRTMSYSLKLLPDADFDTLYQRSLEHLHEKYAEGGYLHLWLNSERNIQGLSALRAIIRDEPRLRTLCREWYEKSSPIA